MSQSQQKLRDICELIVDCEHKTAPTQETGYPSIRTPNIGHGRLILQGVNRVSKETYLKWSKRAIPQANDLILAREAPLGNVAIIPENLKVCLGQRTVLIRPDKEKVVPNYLVYLLLGDEIQGKFYAYSSGATVPHLNMRDIRGLVLPQLPPLPTQRKIAAVLSAYDDLIENNNRRIAILEEMVHLLYREWFVEFRYPGHESVPLVESQLGPVPQGWEVVKLGEICNMKYGKMPKKEDRLEAGYPIFSGYGIVGYHKEYLYEDREIVVIARGVGRCGEIEMSPPFAYITNISIVIQPDIEKVEKLFLFHRLLSTSLTSLNKGTAQTQVTISDITNYEIVVPSMRLQQLFTNIAAGIFRLSESLEQKNQIIRQSRDLLLPRLISGELDVAALDIVGVEV